MRINTNVSGAGNLQQLSQTLMNGARAMERLSSGQRINRASDDAAGLAISELMRAQARGQSMASRNTSDTISMIQTAEGALSETHSALQRMRELAVQAGNAAYTDQDRRALQAEVTQLRSEIDRIGNTTEFNTRNLLDGSAGGAGSPAARSARDLSGSIMSQIGANSGQTAFMSLNDARSAALGVDNLDISTAQGAASALETIDSAIESVSQQRSLLGATQNRFEHTVRNLDVSAQNQTAAQSRIRDADMARVMMESTRNNILLQSSIAMTAQANMSSQGVLQLLVG
ncbi:MAG: flagellin [Chitinispirillales bacterium]|nr:flagellin [Chitinispirillales bacterium]